MTSTKRGRPRLEAQIQKENLLKAALEILDSSGPQGLSMRSLAASLNVTPMALYHHVKDRSALLRDISDWVYSGIVEHSSKSARNGRESIETLLTTYHEAVLRHPNLTLSIFADPEAFSLEAQRITQYLMRLLEKTKISPSERALWLDILVDYTHGSSIATAMSCRLDQPQKSSQDQQSRRYAQGLRALLDRIF